MYSNIYKFSNFTIFILYYNMFLPCRPYTMVPYPRLKPVYCNIMPASGIQVR